jgi:uncharacterized repeat protein (TIGR01451 family)
VTFAGASAGLAPGPSAPRPELAIASRLERLIVAGDGSADTLLAPTAGAGASHADQLIYSVRFTNASERVVDGVRITSAIPADLRYVRDSASGPASDVLFSIDNARSFGAPGELVVVEPGGASRPADPADYTHVRWVFEGVLDAGATGVVRFRAVPR